MSENSEGISKGLDSKIKVEIIKTIESLSTSKDPEIINKIISKLDDPDIEVRGEAFSCLVINENPIAEYLVKGLNSPSKNIRAFCCLILGNRKESTTISHIIPLTKDSSSMVRSCALGALGYLKANEAGNSVLECLSDSSLEVRKSALKTAMDIGVKIPLDELREISRQADEELKKLVDAAKKIC